MTTAMNTLPWVEQKQSELSEMEWDWRRQDELERPYPAPEPLPSLAKREKEREASRLQAELAVGTFIEQFYLAKQVEVGEELIDQIDEKMWGDLDLTRDAMTQFVQAEASRITAPHLVTYWGWPTSRGSHTPDHWLVELPAVYVQDERAQSWEQYRFHVAGKQIKGWTASPSHTAGTYI
jgi:hypothetical protein